MSEVTAKTDHEEEPAVEEEEEDDSVNDGVVISANLLDDIYSDPATDKNGRVEDENRLQGPKFIPPLYMQRYQVVLDLVNKYRPRKVRCFWYTFKHQIFQPPPGRITIVVLS